jgi:hypothetical protein
MLSFSEWEEQESKKRNFLSTSCQPSVFWLPNIKQAASSSSEKFQENRRKSQLIVDEKIKIERMRCEAKCAEIDAISQKKAEERQQRKEEKVQNNNKEAKDRNQNQEEDVGSDDDGNQDNDDDDDDGNRDDNHDDARAVNRNYSDEDSDDYLVGDED